jgi:hypothetical protein
MKKNLLFIALFLISIGLHAQYWSQQNTNMAGTSVGVDQVSVVDSNIVWVNGFNGSGVGGYAPLHAKTINGGTTWTAGTYSGFGATVHSAVLAGVSTTNAFCIAIDTVSSAASFWKTTDGGTTWALVTGVLNGGSTFADGVAFWGNGKGFCYGDPVSSNWDIYTTSDGGTTWNDVPNANMPAPSSASEYGYNGSTCATIVPGGIAWFLTNAGRVIKTSDYGATWTATAAAPFTAIANGQIYASSANYAIIGAYPTSTATVESWKYTTDGGATWDTLAPTGSFYQYQMCYVPGSANTFVATSPFSSTIVGVGYSTDGGLSWADYTDATYLQPAGSNIQTLGVGFYNLNIGWVGNYDAAATINSILKYDNPNGGAGVQTYTVNGNDVNIYPNPSNGFVNFAVNGPNKNDIQIKVYDLAGSMIFEKTLNVNGTSYTSYDFSELSKGMYIVNVSSVNDHLIKKLIIN